MKKKIICFVILAIISSFLIINNLDKKNDIYDNEQVKIKKNNSMLSMMLEQTSGVGDYKTVTQSSWPKEGYKFNSELSKCENDGELSWDDTNKIVVMNGNMSDKCYVYFDIDSEKTLVEYVLSKYTGVQGENNLYYHDSSLANGAGDNNYRYAGPSEEVNNFVCFGSDATSCPTDNLYRIIGIFGENYHGVSGEQLVKLIKYDYANSNLLGTNGDYYGSGTPAASYYKGNLTSINTYNWNAKADTTNYPYGSNIWSTSLLNKTNLNTNFINNIGEIWANKIQKITWKVGGNTTTKIYSVKASVTYSNEITNPASNILVTTKIGLMYVSDYGFAANPSAWTTTLGNYGENVNETAIRSLNWMYMGYADWTNISVSDNLVRAFYVFGNGGVGDFYVYGPNIGVRPSFFLSSSTMYESGVGTMEDPIRIS